MNLDHALDLAEHHLDERRYASALDVLRPYLTQAPADPDLRWCLARIEISRGRAVEGVAILEGLLGEFPNETRFALELASAYIVDLDLVAKGMGLLHDRLRADPQNPTLARHLLWHGYFHAGEPDAKLKELLPRMLRECPHDADVLTVAFAAALRDRDREAASRHLQALVQHHPASPRTRLCFADYATTSPAGALEEFRRLVREFPQDSRLRELAIEWKVRGHWILAPYRALGLLDPVETSRVYRARESGWRAKMKFYAGLIGRQLWGDLIGVILLFVSLFTILIFHSWLVLIPGAVGFFYFHAQDQLVGGLRAYYERRGF